MANKRKELDLKGPNLWYLVGLITSDGCLSSDGRHIDITSKDHNFLEEIKDSFGFNNKIGVKYNALKQKAFRIQISNKNFYDFLLSTGLTPNKSLTLEQVQIPESYFFDFLRGVIDGDGGIQRWAHSTNKREQWSLRVASGSREFLSWLKSKIQKTAGAEGRLYSQSKSQFRLQYGKMAAKVIAQKCYRKGAIAMKRKNDLAHLCISSCKGWGRSKTVITEGG